MRTTDSAREEAPASEPRAYAMAALLAVGLLYSFLPSELLVCGGRWVLLVVVAGLVAPAWFVHGQGKHDWSQRLGDFTLVVIAGFLTASLMMFVQSLPHIAEGEKLLRAAGALWFSNILVFASLYWHLDAGGPHLRQARKHHFEGAAFLFPQMTLPGGPGTWQPGFVDYLFLAFNTNTAFSPTDTPVLTRWAKVATMAQALISLGTVVLVVARAVNVFSAA